MKTGDELRRDEIEGAQQNEPFVRRADGSVIHLAFVVTDPDRSSIAGGPNLVYFVGHFADWVVRAAEREEPSIAVFVEVDVDRFV